jgi:ribosomal protein L2
MQMVKTLYFTQQNLNVGDKILSGSASPLNIGNTLPLTEIPFYSQC